MSAAFLKILNISITAGWLVLAVVLLRFVLRKAPKWVRCILWGIVALRLLLPFSIESSFSLLPSAEPIKTESVAVVSPADPRTTSSVREQVVLNSGFAAVDNAVNPVIAKTAEGVARTDADPFTAFRTAAVWIWALGVGAMLTYAFGSFIYMKLKVRASIETEKNVFVCDDVRSPFVLGAICPKIYLPSGLDAGSRANVLAHERAHIRRLDHLWKPFGFLLLSVHWFNPLIWAAFILFSRDIEFACDEKVISQLDAEGKASYSVTLLSFSRPHKAIAVCPVAFGEVGVKKRVKSVLGYRKSALWTVLTALVAAAAVAACFLTAPKPAIAEQTAEEAQAETVLPAPEPPRSEKETEVSSGEAEQEPEPEEEDIRALIPLNLMLLTNQQIDVDD
ncbi:MAG: M56 family metallopeptidase [Clostridia bacterium]|nr:M56 family metallopeptidase [Clostridia bacterium]